MTTVESGVRGWTAAGLELVAQAFSDGRDDLGRGGAAFCVSHQGEIVIDLWCGDAAPGRPWEADTVSAIFSATKGLVAACLALLYDRGLLDPEEQVSTYWPDFSTDATVRQLLSHQVGLIEVPAWSDLLRLDGTGWDQLPEIRRRLAGAIPAWTPGSMHAYHVMTFGWLAGTLVELISGRPLARFFDEELGSGIGLDLRIGAPDDVVPRMATLIEPARVPGPVGDAIEALLATARDPQTLAGRACIAQAGEGCLDHLAVMGSSLLALRAGGGFGDGVGNARSLSSFYAAVIDGRAGIGRASVDTFRARQCSGPDPILGVPSSFGLGWQCNVELSTGDRRFGPSDAIFGHGGAGGQLGFGDADNDIAVGFVRSHLSHASMLSTRLIETTYAALGLS